MNKANKARVTQVYLCDNAFQDVRNKWNLIGIFTGDMLVEEFPARLRVTLYMEIEMYESTDMEVEFHLDNKRVVTAKVRVE